MSDVKISIGVVLSELRAGLGQGGRMLDDFTKQSKKAREGVMFVSQAVRDIGGSAGVATGALTTMFSQFALIPAGPLLYISLAATALQGLIGFIKESGKAEAEAAKEAKKAHEERRKEYDKTRAELERLRFVQGGGNAEVFDAAQNNALAQAEVKRAKEAVDKARAAFDAAKAAIPAARNVTDEEAAKYYSTLRTLLDKVKSAQAELKEASGHAANVSELGGRKASESVGKEEDTASNAAESARQAAEAKAKVVEAKQEEAKQREIQHANDLFEIRYNLEQETARLAEEKAQREADQEVRAWEVRESMRELEEKTRKEAAEKEQQELERRTQMYAQWGERVGSAVAQMFQKGASPAKAFMALMKDVIKSILQVAIKQITANAATAASGAASSQAAIPVVGPALAAGAMAAMMGLVMGLLSALPSAEGGWDLPNFQGGMLSVLHGGEQVLPRTIADRVRNMTDPQPATNIAISYTVNAIDRAGVAKFFEDHRDVMVKQISDAARRS